MNNFLTWKTILVLVIILSFIGSFFSDHRWISSATIEKLILLTIPEVQRFDTLEVDTKESYNE